MYTLTLLQNDSLRRSVAERKLLLKLKVFLAHQLFQSFIRR